LIFIFTYLRIVLIIFFIKKGIKMAKVGSILIGIILFILGILALIPAINFAALWLAIVMLILGIITLLIGIFNKKA